MSYCKPGWTIDCCAIRSITLEEYNKASGINEISDTNFNFDEIIGLFSGRDPIDELKENPELLKALGSGKLSAFASSPWGHYSYFRDGEFIYLMYGKACFKIRYDQREKVANQLIQLAEGLKEDRNAI